MKDFGYGDLRDILGGVDAVLRSYPIDPQRLGITGWSYGGYMTMWAVTQTNRFKAAVAGAGIANWQSYYGENLIDQWMIPFFGAIGVRRPGGVRQEFADHLHQAGEDADAGGGGRARCRVPGAAVVRVLACAEDAGSADASWWFIPARATCSCSRSTSGTKRRAYWPGLTSTYVKRNLPGPESV